MILLFSNYSGILLVPTAAAGEEKGREARTPRAPARGLRPPAPPADLVPFAAAGEEKGEEARTPRAPARAHRPPDGVCAPGTPCWGVTLFKTRLKDTCRDIDIVMM